MSTLLAVRRNFAQLVVEALADLPPADVSGLDVARHVLSGQVADSAELLALQPQIDAAVDQLESLSTESEKRVKECLKLTPQPSPRLPAGF